MSSVKYILGSRSPRRLELLRQIVPAERIEVVPPLSADERGFEDLHNWPAIESRMLEIARTKCDEVLAQLESGSCFHGDPDEVVAVIAADTMIVATDAAGRLAALGQPPDDDTWGETVRRWFREYYAGRTHVAVTALCVTVLGKQQRHAEGTTRRGDDAQTRQSKPIPRVPASPRPRVRAQRVVKSEVVFRSDSDRWLDWYIATGEPKGKAGGYAIQGAGSIFVSRVEGSLSNVVGLPLRELWELFEELGIRE